MKGNTSNNWFFYESKPFRPHYFSPHSVAPALNHVAQRRAGGGGWRRENPMGFGKQPPSSPDVTSSKEKSFFPNPEEMR